MEDEEAQRQIKQMVNFILNEAKDKAEEIEAKALEEFNIEKLKVVQQMKEKIRQEMTRKAKLQETKRAIARSTAINQARLQKMEKRHKCIDMIEEESKAALIALTNKKGEYEKVLTDLIMEGALRMVEDQVTIRCRKKDAASVNNSISAAADKYAKLLQAQTGLTKATKFVIDTEHLPDDSIGGVILSVMDGKIRLDNTLDSRLRLQMESNMPVIRQTLFPLKWDGIV